jgi:hypothetical protein
MTSNAMLFQVLSNDQGDTNPRSHVDVQLNFVQWGRILVGPQY